jgi:hypothetical protein
MASLTQKQLDEINADIDSVAPSAPQQMGSNFGEAYPLEPEAGPNVEYLVTGLPNNGAVVRFKGKLFYKDDSISGGEELAIPVIKQIERGVPKDQIRTPRQAIESEMRQDVISQAGGPVAGLLGPKKLEGYAGVGSTLDEIAGTIAEASGADYNEVRTNAEALSRSLQGEYPVLSELAKMYGLGESIVGGSKLLPLANRLKSVQKAAKPVVDFFTKTGQAIDKAPPLARHLTNITKATTAAGAEGFAYGLGEGDSSFEGGGAEDRIARGLNRAKDAAVLTAPLATIFPYLGRLVQSRKDAKATVDTLANRLGISVEAARIIHKDLSSGATLQEAVDNMMRAGENRMVADANEAAATLLDSAASQSPSARQQADTAVGSRVQRESEKVISGLDQSVGIQAQRGQTTEQAVMEGTKQARQEAYEEAYKPRVDVSTPEGDAVVKMLETLDADDLEEQLKRANKLLRNKADKVDYDIVDGKVVFFGEPTVKFLDSLKKSLQSKAQGLKYDDPEMYLLYSEIARDVKSVTEGVSEAYGKAVELGGDVIATREAGKMGETALSASTKLDDVISQLQGASKTELLAAQAGLRRNIQNIIEDVKTAAGKSSPEESAQMQKLLRELSSSSNRQKLEIILGREQAQKFLAELDQAKAAFELQSRVAVGSGTAQRSAFGKSLEDEVSGGFMTKLLSGDKGVIPELRDILTGASQQWKDERREMILRDIISVLAGRTGKEADIAMNYIRQAARGQLSNAQASYIAEVLKGASLPANIGVAGQRTMGEE